MRSTASWVAVALVLAGCVGVRPAGDDAIEAFLARHWRQPLAAQGPVSPGRPALEASLAPEACGQCHPAQYADWRTSLHAAAMGPGVVGQLASLAERDPAAAVSCQRCHAPLAEQAPTRPDTREPNPGFDASLRRRGVPCAGCHVRGHARYGPPRRDGSLPDPASPGGLPHGGATRTIAFLDSRFCRGCHQFAADGHALNGKLLQDTYREWQASRFAGAGVHCQDCHMPDRRHLWRGIHDPEMVESGVVISVEAAAGRLILKSTNVGHLFPTYVTPLVVLRAEQVDAAGRVLPGTRREHRIGREVTLDLEHEIADTRLAPGESAVLAWPIALVPGAARTRLRVLVYPDAFYTAFFEALLEQGAGPGESQIREALAATRRSPFLLFEREVAP